MASKQPDQGEELTERERAHVRHRDKKRRTEMVVDNAGVKRITAAIAQKRITKRER